MQVLKGSVLIIRGIAVKFQQHCHNTFSVHDTNLKPYILLTWVSWLPRIISARGKKMFVPVLSYCSVGIWDVFFLFLAHLLCSVTVQLPFQALRMHKIQGSSFYWGVVCLEMSCRHTCSFKYSHFRVYVDIFKGPMWLLMYQSRFRPCFASWSSYVVFKKRILVYSGTLRLEADV